MNLFEPEPEVNKENEYLNNIHAEKMHQYKQYVNIRIEVRNLISGMDGLKLQLAKEILSNERSTDEKVRNKYYKNILKKYEDLNKLK